MDQEFLQSLTPEETEQFNTDVKQSLAGIEAKRNAGKQAELQKAYEAERNQIAQTHGRNVETRTRLLTDLKLKYRALGLGV